MPRSLAQGDLVELDFEMKSGPVHGMVEILSPVRKTNEGVLQPFRFVALEDDDDRRLRTSLDSAANSVVDRSWLDFKSKAFSIT